MSTIVNAKTTPSLKEEDAALTIPCNRSAESEGRGTAGRLPIRKLQETG